MLTSHRFAITDESQVGATRRAVAELGHRHALSETDTGRLSIIVTELGRNLVRHAGGGELVAREISHGTDYGVEILSIDRGPGISNIAEAFRDGYSTGGTAGTGLGAVRRLGERFDIFSQPGKGTIVGTYVGPTERNGARFQIGAVSLPLASEFVCGDRWDFETSASSMRLLVADGLGHGPFAEEAAREAVAVFRAKADAAPAHTMDLIHLALGKTRGAAGAIVRIDVPQQKLTSAGIGNIAMRVIGEDGAKSLISDNGTLGGNARRAHEAAIPWKPETFLVMHSDGLGSHWNFSDYPGVSNRHPSTIAALLYRDHRRERDDATVVVLREIR